MLRRAFLKVAKPNRINGFKKFKKKLDFAKIVKPSQMSAEYGDKNAPHVPSLQVKMFNYFAYIFGRFEGGGSTTSTSSSSSSPNRSTTVTSCLYGRANCTTPCVNIYCRCFCCSFCLLGYTI
mmetsp:Transcript_13822/g.15350  ORF Transcript_13822/g.15350 Transcript_13822/m.15350 type:complete len:122 (-) Transcript_13822:316-681(-)